MCTEEIKAVEVTELFETNCWYDFETATELANNWTKGCYSDGTPMPGAEKAYYTAVKGKPFLVKEPKDCWKVTNMFDPRVKR